MDIVFVILHYMVEEETCKCVEYIRKRIDTKDYHIVIVDNASPDDSGKRIEKAFAESRDVTVILNKENLGFARGNNVGFFYAKQQWNPKYIVLMNNDVYLLERELFGKLEQEYSDSRFAVLGPLIMTGDGRCNVNPIRVKPMEKEDVVKEIRLYRRKKIEYQYYLIGIKNFFYKIIKGNKASTIKKNKDYIERKENVQLHGCFMAFSQEYIEKFDGLDDRTFLYREEAILYKHMLENHMKTVYLPDIMVFHKEDASTDQLVKTEREKALFEIKNHLDSLNVMLEVYEFYDKQGSVLTERENGKD